MAETRPEARVPYYDKYSRWRYALRSPRSTTRKIGFLLFLYVPTTLLFCFTGALRLMSDALLVESDDWLQKVIVST